MNIRDLPPGFYDENLKNNSKKGRTQGSGVYCDKAFHCSICKKVYCYYPNLIKHILKRRCKNG